MMCNRKCHWKGRNKNKPRKGYKGPFPPKPVKAVADQAKT